jgi:hypothetical protein
MALVCLLHAGTAQASFHLTMVVAVFPGYAGSPNAQYVEVQMYAAGQNFVAGHSVLVYDAAGTLVGTFTFPGYLPNGADQAGILIATAEAQTLFGVTPDLLMTPSISASGGKVCFDGPTPPDCVAWGNYSGSSAGVGNPFSPGGLPLGRAAQRRLDRGIPGVLDPADDTDDSATDFVDAAPAPRNNANVTGAVAGYASTPAPPGPIAFGSMVVGFDLAANLLVQEAGGRTLTVSNPVLGGANPGDFSVETTFPLDIPDGAQAETVSLGCRPQAVGARSATLTLTTNDPNRPTVAYDLTCTGLPVPPSLSFYTVNPCRVVDTRLGGGPVVAGTDRTFTMVGGTCGVPATAQAVSLNVTVTQPTAPGNVRLFPAGGAVPNASTINYTAGLTRANNAVIGLGAAGELTARCQPSGSTHLVLDVNGYFAP